jgi:hypothetical protein
LGGLHLFDANNVKLRSNNPRCPLQEWRMEGTVRISLYKLMGFGIEGDAWEVITFEVRVGG